MHNNVTSTRSHPRESKAEALARRVKEAADLLEQIDADRTLLANLPEAHRNRILKAAGRVSRPDAIDRRRLL